MLIVNVTCTATKFLQVAVNPVWMENFLGLQVVNPVCGE